MIEYGQDWKDGHTGQDEDRGWEEGKVRRGGERWCGVGFLVQVSYPFTGNLCCIVQQNDMTHIATHHNQSSIKIMIIIVTITITTNTLTNVHDSR